MSRLFNTTVHIAMNDISVTTGNADGWVVLAREPVVPTTRLSAAKRTSEATEKKTRPSRKARP